MTHAQKRTMRGPLSLSPLIRWHGLLLEVLCATVNYCKFRNFRDNFILANVLLNRGYFVSAHVLLSLINELRKRDKKRGLSSILSPFSTASLINSIIQEHIC